MSSPAITSPLTPTCPILAHTPRRALAQSSHGVGTEMMRERACSSSPNHRRHTGRRRRSKCRSAPLCRMRFGPRSGSMRTRPLAHARANLTITRAHAYTHSSVSPHLLSCHITQTETMGKSRGRGMGGRVKPRVHDTRAIHAAFDIRLRHIIIPAAAVRFSAKAETPSLRIYHSLPER